MSIKGRIHSYESCGTVDGPGIRFLVFTQGCPLRCQYCHNPDTWNLNSGKEVTSDEVFNEIRKYKSYMKFSNGGVTISGGDPLLQIDFVKDILKKCKDENIHTAIDTSGHAPLDKIKGIIDYTDLFLLDIKAFDRDIFKEITGVYNDNTLKLAKYLSEINKPVWIRYVLVPGLSDNLEDINNLAKFISSLSNVERFEILPFHKMGEYKWEELDYEYKLKNTSSPSEKLLKKVKSIFEKHNVFCNSDKKVI